MKNNNENNKLTPKKLEEIIVGSVLYQTEQDTLRRESMKDISITADDKEIARFDSTATSNITLELSPPPGSIKIYGVTAETGRTVFINQLNPEKDTEDNVVYQKNILGQGRVLRLKGTFKLDEDGIAEALSLNINHRAVYAARSTGESQGRG